MSEFKFEIKEHIGVLSESTKGWQKELTLVSWNEKAPKYDIREWSPDYEKMGKGVTLNLDEMRKLKEMLNSLDI